MSGIYTWVILSAGNEEVRKFLMIKPAESLSVRTIIPVSPASLLISFCFSLSLKIPKPSVFIISPSIRLDSLIMSYLPSTIMGFVSLIMLFHRF